MCLELQYALFNYHSTLGSVLAYAQNSNDGQNRGYVPGTNEITMSSTASEVQFIEVIFLVPAAWIAWGIQYRKV